MPQLITVSADNLKANTIYRRLTNGQPMSRDERRELATLHNHAFRGQLEAIIAPPRLVRTDIRPLACLSLAGMLRSHPAYDDRRVELVGETM